jgi:hypothetical protein
MGTMTHCVTFRALQIDELNARLKHQRSVPVGVPSLMAETGARLGPDVRASGPTFPARIRRPRSEWISAKRGGLRVARNGR